MALALKYLKNVVTPHFNLKKYFQFQQIRTNFGNARMLKDYRRRQTVKKYGPERLRLIMFKKATILPSIIKEAAAKDIALYPRDASANRTVSRCVLTSRPRGTVKYFRVSRIVFRELADYNKLSGVQRAFW